MHVISPISYLAVSPNHVNSPLCFISVGGGTSRVGLLFVWTIFCGLVLLNSCILCNTLSFAVHPPSTLLAASDFNPCPPPTTPGIASAGAPTGWAPAPLGPELPSLLCFLFPLASPDRRGGSFSAFLCGRGSPCFFRAGFSSLEQTSTKSWHESSIMVDMILH